MNEWQLSVECKRTNRASRLNERANELPNNKCQVKRDTEHIPKRTYTHTHAHTCTLCMTCSINVKGSGSKYSLQSRAMLPLGLMAHIHTNPFYTWFFVLFFIFLQHSCSPPPKCLWSTHFSVALFYFPTDGKKIDAKNKVKQKTRKCSHVLWAKLILILFFSCSLSRPFISYTTRYWFFWASMMKSHRLLIYDNNRKKMQLSTELYTMSPHTQTHEHYLLNMYVKWFNAVSTRFPYYELNANFSFCHQNDLPSSAHANKKLRFS